MNMSQSNNFVFISYRRLDSSGYAVNLHKRLSRAFGKNSIFIDIHSIPGGCNFGDTIYDTINKCKVVLIIIGKKWATECDSNDVRRLDLLDDHVRIEVEKALRSTAKVIPVLVGGALMPEKYILPDGLKNLCDINAFSISDSRIESDTKNLISLIRSAFPVGINPVKIKYIESPEVPVLPNSTFYIERPEDDEVVDLQQHEKYTINIVAPQKMGKSSFLARVKYRAESANKKTFELNFPGIDSDILVSMDKFIDHFARDISAQILGQESEWLNYLNEKGHDISFVRLNNFVRDRVLPSCDPGGMLLVLEESDVLLKFNPKGVDFFNKLRAWHNEGNGSRNGFGLLSIAQTMTIDPYLINGERCNFNVGAVVGLQDFDLNGVKKLLYLHGLSLKQKEVSRIYELLGGHPYLTRRACWLISSKKFPLSDIFSKASTDDGPFKGHLGTLYSSVQKTPKAKELLSKIILSGGCEYQDELRDLIEMGLLKRMNKLWKIRNLLYRDYFDRILL